MKPLPWQQANWPRCTGDLAALGQQVDFDPWLKHGNLPRWLEILRQLPPATVDEFSTARWVGPVGHSVDSNKLRHALEQLKPWRKGPYRLFDVEIDTEWRSDLKWDRIRSAIPRDVKQALDVGCGSGYHLWRLAEAGCEQVLGIDPSLLFAIQFAALQHYALDPRIHYWPIPLEAMPRSDLFDLALSMGVLYHRRSPIDHLTQLKDQLRPGGRLILETLVIEGDRNTVLTPADRYARMRNCWFLPSVEALALWLERCGFVDIQCIDQTWTTSEEQRLTPWIGGQSLESSLDPEDPTRTVEGHPAPLRATLIANRPA